MSVCEGSQSWRKTKKSKAAKEDDPSSWISKSIDESVCEEEDEDIKERRGHKKNARKV